MRLDLRTLTYEDGTPESEYRRTGRFRSEVGMVTENFSTGSHRDTRVGKGRFDLISPVALEQLAVHLEKGAAHYGDRNWEKGQPFMRYVDSALRHINNFLKGKEDENHLAAAMWNLMALIHTMAKVEDGSLPKVLDDRPWKQEEIDTTEYGVYRVKDNFSQHIRYFLKDEKVKMFNTLTNTFQEEHGWVPEDLTWEHSLLVKVPDEVFSSGKIKKIDPVHPCDGQVFADVCDNPNTVTLYTGVWFVWKGETYFQQGDAPIPSKWSPDLLNDAHEFIRLPNWVVKDGKAVKL